MHVCFCFATQVSFSDYNIKAKQYFGFQDGCIRLFLLSIMMVSVILSIRVMMKIKSVYCDYRGWFTYLPIFP